MLLDLWIMVWLTCTSQGCGREYVEQEFPTRAECQATLDWYRDYRGVFGICTQAWP